VELVPEGETELEGENEMLAVIEVLADGQTYVSLAGALKILDFRQTGQKEPKGKRKY